MSVYEEGWILFCSMVATAVFALGLSVGVSYGRELAMAETAPLPAVRDTLFVFPEPMHVGSTLGLHCYIERRDPQ
jgi:hypothetical protein